jgi:hypothetical protein
VAIPYKDEHEKLQSRLTTNSKNNLIFSSSYADEKVKFATHFMIARDNLSLREIQLGIQ